MTTPDFSMGTLKVRRACTDAFSNSERPYMPVKYQSQLTEKHSTMKPNLGNLAVQLYRRNYKENLSLERLTTLKKAQ